MAMVELTTFWPTYAMILMISPLMYQMPVYDF